MNAKINTLFQSDFYKILDFKCNCFGKETSGTEYSKSFNISFIRKGNFVYNTYRNSFDAYSGYAILDKPECEHTVGHCHHIPDECTIIDFSDDFYNQLIERESCKTNPFFKNKDIQSVMLRTSPAIEYLHYSALSLCTSKNSVKLMVDSMILEILQWFINRINNNDHYPVISSRLKYLHLNTIEQAKSYILNNYMNDISLFDIATYSAVSPFHFSRIFKSLTNTSPYKFLLDIRLKNSEQLIKNSNLPIFDIAIQSGFNGVENFDAIFKQRFKKSPMEYRKYSL